MCNDVGHDPDVEKAGDHQGGQNGERARRTGWPCYLLDGDPEEANQAQPMTNDGVIHIGVEVILHLLCRVLLHLPHDILHVGVHRTVQLVSTNADARASMKVHVQRAGTVGDEGKANERSEEGVYDEESQHVRGIQGTPFRGAAPH